MTIRDAVAGDARGIATVRVRSWQAAYRGLMPQDALDGMSIDRNTENWGLAIAAVPANAGLVVWESPQ